MSFGDFAFSDRTFADTGSVFVVQVLSFDSVQSDETHGLHQLNRWIHSSSVQAGETIGSHNLAQDRSLLMPTMGNLIELGSHQLNMKIHQTNAIAGVPVGSIQLGEMFGNPVFRYDAYLTFSPIQTNATYGSHRLNRNIKPVSVPTGKGIGSFELSFLKLVQPTSIPTAESFGSFTFAYLQTILMSGADFSSNPSNFTIRQRIKVLPISTGKAIGTFVISNGAGVPGRLIPIGGLTAGTVSTNFIVRGVLDPLVFASVASEEAVNSFNVVRVIRPHSTQNVNVGDFFLLQTAAPIAAQMISSLGPITAGSQFGTMLISIGLQSLFPAGIDETSIGSAVVVQHQPVQYITPGSVHTNNRVRMKLIVYIPFGSVSPSSSFGSFTTFSGNAVIRPSGISEGSVGSFTVFRLSYIPFSSISSVEVVPAPKIFHVISFAGIPSEEQPGAFTLRISRTIIMYSAQYAPGACGCATVGCRTGFGSPAVTII